MGSSVLFILRSRLLVYSAVSGVNRVQVVLSGFSVILLCFVPVLQGSMVCLLLCKEEASSSILAITERCYV